MGSDYQQELAATMAKITDPKLMESFLHNILTPTEFGEVSKRLQIFKMLNDGISQRKISKALGVSMATITRGSRELKYGEKGVSKVLDKYVQNGFC